MNHENLSAGVWPCGRGPAFARGRSDWPANHRLHYFCIKKANQRRLLFHSSGFLISFLFRFFLFFLIHSPHFDPVCIIIVYDSLMFFFFIIDLFSIVLLLLPNTNITRSLNLRVEKRCGKRSVEIVDQRSAVLDACGRGVLRGHVVKSNTQPTSL